MKSKEIKYETEFVREKTAVIRRVMPDKSKEIVGYIIREINGSNRTIINRSYSTDGKEVLPPKDDYIEAVVQYENLLMNEDGKAKTVVTPIRKAELKNIRREKNKTINRGR